ncbi:MAG: ATP-binding protein [Bacteroidetes bacterium]|nr:ATP-binding protein [Bacteroidota bacterium]
MIKRKIEKKALSILKWSPSIILLGSRQIGKTTLAKSLRTQLDKPSIYLDLENINDFNRIQDTSLFFNENKDKCVIIDEVQRFPELFARLRGIIDSHRVPARFILLGSASPTILKKSTESLTGRAIYLELPGILWEEVNESKSLEEHWLKGGFPTALLSKKNTINTIWFQSFLKNFIEMDLPQIKAQIPSLTLYRLIRMLAHSHGGLWNASTFSKSLGVSSQTISSYRDLLEKTYLINILPPFFTNVKKRIIKSPKVYIKDSGVLHYLSHIVDFNQLLGHPIIGHSWEGYIVEQIISYVKIISDEFLEFSFYRTREGTECDLIISRGIKAFIAIEMKMSTSPQITRSFSNAIKDLDTKHNYILIPECKHPYSLNNNIRILDLSNMLNELNTIFKKY